MVWYGMMLVEQQPTYSTIQGSLRTDMSNRFGHVCWCMSSPALIDDHVFHDCDEDNHHLLDDNQRDDQDDPAWTCSLCQGRKRYAYFQLM